jgi:8-oxo-dGTP diphosphatase
MPISLQLANSFRICAQLSYGESEQLEQNCDNSEMAMYKDSAGRTLDSYPHPSVAVDTAVLTATDSLRVLLVRSDGGWRLPGTFLHEDETLAAAVLRSLQIKAGVSGLWPRQLHVFDEPNRDNRGWVLSVAHLDAVPAAALAIDPELAQLAPIADLPPLPYHHELIVERAVAALQDEYLHHPDPRELLAEPFTLRDLQTLHEAVAGAPLPRDTFRRAMEPQLSSTGATGQGSVGKPARLFTRKAA